MLKMIFCLRRKEGLTREEFQAYWRDSHAPLVLRLAPALGIRRYLQCHSLDDPRIGAAAAVRGGAADAFDGVAELYWDSVEDVLGASRSKEGRDASRQLLDDERRFIDLPGSPLFWAREDVVVD